MITLESDLTIGVDISKSLEEGQREFFMEIDVTDNIYNRVKSG